MYILRLFIKVCCPEEADPAEPDDGFPPFPFLFPIFPVDELENEKEEKIIIRKK